MTIPAGKVKEPMPQEAVIGDVSGNLTVTRLLPDYRNKSGKRYQRAHVLCTCGHSFDIHANRITKGIAKRCPRCVRAPLSIDRPGDTHDQLSILSIQWEKGTNRRMALCRCSCGNQCVRLVKLFRRNKSFNCGCRPLPSYKGVGNLSGTFWKRLKDNAKARSLTVEVTKAQLWGLFLEQKQLCAISGLPLSLNIRGEKSTASVDRIDSSKGYRIGNVQWVHKDINRMKQNFPLEHFLQVCRQITEHQRGSAPEHHQPTKQRRRQKPGKKTNIQTTW